MNYTADGVTYTGFSLLLKQCDILKGEIVLVTRKNALCTGIHPWTVEDKLGLDNLTSFYKREYKGWPVLVTPLEVIVEPVEHDPSKGGFRFLLTEKDVMEARYIVLAWFNWGVDLWLAESQIGVASIRNLYDSDSYFALTITRKKCTH